jgi:hypothetical protein
MTSEPPVYTFGDCLPAGLKHHVMTHVREELSFCAVCECGHSYLVLRETSVTLGAQDEQWNPI